MDMAKLPVDLLVGSRCGCIGPLERLAVIGTLVLYVSCCRRDAKVTSPRKMRSALIGIADVERASTRRGDADIVRVELSTAGERGPDPLRPANIKLKYDDRTEYDCSW